MASHETRNVTTGEKIELQLALQRLGFYHDKVDGLWGRNSITAMAEWQRAHAFPLADGIPTYQQMVVLGATKPEVVRRKRTGTGWLRLLPLAFALLPKVNLKMNPFLLALGRVNKATVTAIVTLLATILLVFGIDLQPDLQGILITVGTAIVSGLATWLVPNVPPKPVAVAQMLQTAISNSTPEEYLEYVNSTWPATSDPNLTGDTFDPPPVPAAVPASVASDAHTASPAPRV